LLEGHPGWYLRGVAGKFNVCPQAIGKMFKKLGVTRKRNFYLLGKPEKEREAFMNRTAEIPEKSVSMPMNAA
jgi:hypothetical protein